MSMEATVSVERIGVALGAVVHGIDLGKPLSDVRAREVEAALYEHQVLFFREQHLTAEEQMNVATVFGVLRAPQPGRFLGETNPLMTLERSPGKPPATDFWHTDVPFVEEPPIVGVLSAMVMPPVGGDTAWASTYSLYDSLSEPIQSLCEGLHGEHTLDETLAYVRARYGEEAVRKVSAAFPLRLHPLVQVHPRTGRRYIYLGAAGMSSIAGISKRESDLLLGYLRTGLDDINIQLRWRWTPGDVAIWDERSTVHQGLSDHFAVDPHRVLRSLFVDGRDE
jgi:taurine dioxygenase